MLQGKCLDPDILPTYETFYLFPVGNNHFYASKFPRKSAHTGCFQKKHFHIKEVNEEAEWPPEPTKRAVEVELNVIYTAKLIWCWKSSKKMLGKIYFVIARGSGSHVDVYVTEDLKGMLASYPVHWFENFDLVDRGPEIEKTETASDQAMEEEKFDDPQAPQVFEQLSLF